MEIRELRQEDAQSLSTLILEIYEESPNSTTFARKPEMSELYEAFAKKILGMKDGRIVDSAAMEKGRVIGDCEIVRAGDEDGLVGILVKKEHRRTGLGSRLLRESLEKARVWRLKRIRAEVNSLNGPALAFFLKNGFGEEGKEKEIKIMTKSLLP